MIAPISLEKRIANSELIVEGKVIDSKAIKSENNQINTLHLIEVYTLYKGKKTAQTISVITPGGLLDNVYHKVSPALELNEEEKGIFLLIPAEHNTYKPYSGPQGFIRYNFNGGYASDPFNRYDASLHQTITNLCEQSPQHFSKIERPYKQVKQAKSGPITGISPEVITAGTKSVLTITGTGFGAIRGSGKVIFQNASSGPTDLSPENAEYISWKDNEIKVQVPSGAGTGPVTVSKSGSSTSLQILTIEYAQLNVVTSLGVPYQTSHINDNTQGGYTFFTSPGFNANTAATATFERALINWRNATCINWQLGGSTAGNSTGQDGTNIVRFGNNGELPGGVLAVTSSYYSACGSGTNQVWSVSEIDITYAPDINWNFGSGSPKFGEYDMESVTIHELGHAHQLGHVINDDDIMHRSIGPQVRKRDLTPTNGRAGKFVQAQSVVKKSCGPASMTNYPGCTATGISSAVNSSSQHIFPNPARNQFHIATDLLTEQPATVEIYDLSGKVVLQTNVSSINNTVKTIGLQNGTYLLRLTSNNQQLFTDLFVVSR
jgi:hypothetical protein